MRQDCLDGRSDGPKASVYTVQDGTERQEHTSVPLEGFEPGTRAAKTHTLQATVIDSKSDNRFVQIKRLTFTTGNQRESERFSRTGSFRIKIMCVFFVSLTLGTSPADQSVLNFTHVFISYKVEPLTVHAGGLTSNEQMFCYIHPLS
jgi:hypothetical protein